MEKSSKKNGYSALLVTSIVWGTTWVVSKIGVKQFPALEMAGIRQLIGGICFLGYFIFYKKYPFPTGKQFGWLLMMALLMFVMANGLSTWSINFIPTGLSALIGALYPLSVVVIERIFFGSRNITSLTFVGLLLGIVGIGIVFYEHAFHEQPKGFLFGILLSVIAMLAWSGGTIFISRNKLHINAYYGLGWQMFLGSFILLILSWCTQPFVALQNIPIKIWLVIGYLVFFGSIIAFVAFIYSMQKLPVAIASLYAYINPLIAMCGAAIILDEPLTWNILWGSLVTLAGVFTVNYSIKKNKEKPMDVREQ